MPIVQSAPGGWEFQYTATALIGLFRLCESGLTLFVEPKGGEDAELALDVRFENLVVEIQAKSSQSDVGSKELATFLAHFPEGQATNNLLARLVQDKNRVALLIVAGRCNDATRGFLAHVGDISSHSVSPVNRAHFDDLIEEFTKVYQSKKQSKLDVNRAAFCEKVAANLRGNFAADSNILRRVLVWEQVHKNDLEQRIEHFATREYLVPTSRSRAVRLEFVEAVRAARDQKIDLLPKLKSIAASFAGTRLLSEEYLDRGIESKLFDELKERRALLLTGQSMCGKSQMARRIAEEFQNVGFSCETGTDVHEAIRYLRAVGQDDRLFLLDDPFGHLTLEARAVEDLSRLQDLIVTLPVHRFLIVTSRWDVISLLGATIPIHGVKWHDLTIKEADFLTAFWQKKCAEKGLSTAAFNTVLKNLSSMSQNELLQPGQLRHLAAITETVPEMDFGALCSLARCNSNDLATTFKHRGYDAQRLHAALALSATNIRPVPLQCLNYILTGHKSQPGVHRPEQFEALTLGYEDPPPPFPEYPKLSPISAPLRGELGVLEQRGFIRIANAAVVFTHPDYFESSTLVLLGFPSIHFDDLLEIASRAIASLHPSSAKSALRQLSRMRKNYVEAEQKQRIQELAFFAFDSIFPTVRDLALTTLVSWIDRLEKDDQERVLNLVRRMHMKYEEIIWHEDIPWLNPKPRTGVEQLFGIGIPLPDRNKVTALIDRLLDTKNSLSVQEAWTLVTSLKSERATTNFVPALKALMAFEEGFIRAKAAFLWMANVTENDQAAIALALGDEHPAVVFEAMRGCFVAFHRYDDALKSAARENIQRALANSAVAVYANRFLMDFGDSEGLRESELESIPQTRLGARWMLWAEIVPVFLRTVSQHSIWINESHLWHTTREACKYLSPVKGLQICEAWLKWIEVQLKRSLPDDYGFAVAQFLIEVTRSAPEVRAEMSSYLLTHSDTAFLLSSVREYLSHWTDLTAEELAKVITLCHSARTDVRWIRALALTREFSQSDVVEAIVGASTLSTLSASELVALLPGELIQDCLCMYTGDHPLLYYLGLSSASHEPWHRVLEYSVERPNSPHFGLSLREMMRSALNGGSKWRNAYRIWAVLCNSADEALREHLFRELLIWTIQINGNKSDVFWRVLLNRIKDSKELDNYIQQIIDNIEAVWNSSDDLPEKFGRKRFYSKMLPKLPSDSLVIKSLTTAKRFDFEPTFHDETIALLDVIYQKSAPRLLGTHDAVLRYAKDHGGNTEFIAHVEAARTRTLKISSEQRTHFDEQHPESLPGWMSWRERVNSDICNE